MVSGISSSGKPIMDIGEAFFSSKKRTLRFATGNLLPYSLAEFRQALPVRLVPALHRVTSCRNASGTRGGAGSFPGCRAARKRCAADPGSRCQTTQPDGAQLSSAAQDSFLAFKTWRPL